MTPTPAMMDRLAVLLATDATTLAEPLLALHVHLVMANFNPLTVTVPGDLTLATFTGSTPKNAGLGAQQEFVDPTTGLRTIQMLEPAGGWHWEATNTVNLPQTIYGFGLTDNANAVLYGTALLPSPVVLQAANEGVDVDQVRFSVLDNALG